MARCQNVRTCYRLILLVATIFTIHKGVVTFRGKPRIAMIDCSTVLINECEALRGLGYTIINYTQNVGSVDLLWTLDTARTPRGITVMANMTNHIPATKPLYTKRDLLTAGDISVIPPAFILPQQKEEFKTHALERLTKDPDTMWMEKASKHHGVKISDLSDILSSEYQGLLVQEYLSNPLLISNRKFDIGVFGLVTSASPLRLYLYTSDFETLFCSKDYLPFDPNIHGKYRPEEPFTKVWQIPDLKELAGNIGEKKDINIMYRYLENQGFDSSKLHNDIVAAVSEVGCKREKYIAAHVENTGKVISPKNSFELLRFDVSVQRDLSVRVIEVNKTPGTDSQDEHKGMFVKMLTDTMVLAGLVDASWTEEKVAETTDVNTVSDAEINVDHEDCLKCSPELCKSIWICHVCTICLTEADKQHFRMAVLEHRRPKLSWIRIVPPSFKNQEAAKKTPMSNPLYGSLSKSTKIMYLWYRRKCLRDAAWCS